MSLSFLLCLGFGDARIMKLRDQSKAAFQNILDTMTGADGGVRFLYFKVLIEEMDKRASEGDADAQTLIDVMIRFSRLIDVSQKK